MLQRIGWLAGDDYNDGETIKGNMEGFSILYIILLYAHIK